MLQKCKKIRARRTGLSPTEIIFYFLGKKGGLDQYTVSRAGAREIDKLKFSDSLEIFRKKGILIY